MNPDRYDTAIANVRETVKWLIGAIGAVFVTLLAGVQFNHLPFASDRWTAAAAVAAALGIMITFALAIRTLGGPDISFEALAASRKFEGARRFINSAWTGGDVVRLWETLQSKDSQLQLGKITSQDAHYKELNDLADQLLHAAKWHVVKTRFDRLVIGMMILVPLELGAAAIMFSHADTPDGGALVTLEVKAQR